MARTLYFKYLAVPEHQFLPEVQGVLGFRLLQVALGCLVDPVGLIHLWAWHF